MGRKIARSCRSGSARSVYLIIQSLTSGNTALAVQRLRLGAQGAQPPPLGRVAALPGAATLKPLGWTAVTFSGL